ncbi:MAG: GNAT family N-acetyltransferase [Micrococcales bacterium]|nr:GNAT family N-acetyltransferase [Micrococcales bacterium]
MTIRIDRAHLRDLTKVKPLWKAMLADYRELSDGVWEVREPQEAWQRRHQEYLEWINDAGGVVFLATDTDTETDEIVGYAALRFVTSGATFDLGESFGDIETLAVKPGYRGKGVGAALLAACQRELERREIKFVSLQTLASNEKALRLYERAGFQPFMTRLVRRVDDGSE